MNSSGRPSLPLFYFENSNIDIPAEVLHRCLLEFAEWGDLARLAAVQTSWSHIMYEAASSDPLAAWSLAQALLHGTDGLSSNPHAAMKLLRTLSGLEEDECQMPLRRNAILNEFSAAAMKEIATYYLPNNPTAGLAWLEAAYEVGNNLDAAHEVALVYENGSHGIEVDVVGAVAWFEKAAEGGHVEAMAELGLCYELGLAVEQSDEKALEWYMKAAEKGHLTAKYSIGEAFEEARGVPQSDAEACLWYYRAAIDGDEDSRRALRRLEDIARIVLPGVGRLLDE
ncbi:uncharacterized protein FisN_12Hh223 [Fistulifera solaris]|uniref:Uncharacterized protein n=1 Tax=Fistulifera solaris TaxID=1519565 RepID=A0A1Z5KBI4_FISSO|nr:uncharacterized protein FisN_12Hh223 [Fistulifera solaris]|eukprot:GAX23650.1 uncharacterized protein FisN_12Hh223 [Fistulifera solaris]